MTVTICFGLAAALANAVHLMTQHAASVGVSDTHRGRELVAFLIRQPLWLLGWAAGAAAFAFQAVALHSGQLSIVQPLLVTELVFALLLRRFWLRQHIAKTAWTAALVTCAAAHGLLDCGRPPGWPAATRRGRLGFGAGRLRGCRRCIGRAGALGITCASRALYATSASITWALMAAFIKATTDVLTSSGVVATVEHWPLYALIASAVLGLVLQQAALQVGPLSVSQPLIVVVDPAVAIVLSVWIFDEGFTTSVSQRILAAAAFCVMATGVTLLSRTAPTDLDPSMPART